MVTQGSTASQAQIDADLARLESMIRELKIQYDMFFAGSRKLPPRERHAQVEKFIRRYLNAPMPRYANRFHFNALVSRFNSHSELWVKTVRKHEEGDRGGRAADVHGFREKLVARCKTSDPNSDESAMRGLYKRFQEAQRTVGREGRTVSFDRFVKGISAQTSRLQENAGCGEIELRLVICDDKVQLRARSGK